MFRFLCFNTHSLSHKQKKTLHLSTEAMKKTLGDSSLNETRKNFAYLPVANTLNLNVEAKTLKSCADCPIDTFAVEGYSNSDEGESVRDHSVLETGNIKKSQSLGTGLYLKGRDSGGSASEDAIDQRLSFDGSHDNCGSLVRDGGKDSRTSPPDQFQEAHQSDSLYVHGGVGNDEFVFSVGEAPHSDKESHENITDAGFSCGANSGNHTPRTPIFEKSCSLPNIDSPGHVMVSSLRCIKSAEDLSTLDSRRKDMLTGKFKTLVFQHQEKNDTLISIDNKNHSDNPVDDICINYNYVGSPKGWIIPLDELDINDNHGGNSSFHMGDELRSKDFKVKRIEEWVTDLQHCSPLDESDEFSPLDDHTVPLDDHTVPTGVIVLDVSPATKLEDKFSPGMEAAKKYISSLGTSATAAQLVNYGLAVIPFLSPFSSLRHINLSGNAIVRITAGSLPRGLHMLNLSKNKISTIEGLRELTRLRVLDLGYNRILRIGHGLASCSSLKELYLAGNKISEVEGLHRLLKLTVLDLRFNKVSTTKGLGQLAANYNSLQAISIEGNPAQKNVGDDQVKKFLQGLLPHLTYFNRQPIKVGTLKDTADRSARLGIGAHQMDRGFKADHKLARKGTHAAATGKVASSSTHHGRRSQATAASKLSKSKHPRLRPSGTKAVAQQSHSNAMSSKLQSFKSNLSMRRSHSEGTLGAL